MVRKKTTKKVVRKKVTRKIIPKRVSMPDRIPKSKVRLAVHNFLGSIMAFILFFMLYTVSTNILYKDLFFILALVSGFTTVAFVIVLLIFGILKILKI